MERYPFQLSLTTSEPPTGAQIRTDNADPSLATRLWVRDLTTDNEDVHNALALVRAGDAVYMQDYDDHTLYVRYDATADAVEKDGYVELAVRPLVIGTPLAAQKVSLYVVAGVEAAPTPPPVTPSPYATVDELAAALRIRATAENTATLQACLDAAAAEIDHETDRVDAITDSELYALANRVNVTRGVEWYKANDAAFGVIGFAESGALQAPRDGFNRHAYTLTPLKQQWGIA